MWAEFLLWIWTQNKQLLCNTDVICVCVWWKFCIYFNGTNRLLLCCCKSHYSNKIIFKTQQVLWRVLIHLFWKSNINMATFCNSNFFWENDKQRLIWYSLQRSNKKNNKKKIRREGQRVKQLKYELSWSQEMWKFKNVQAKQTKSTEVYCNS